ncbi:MAG: O-antigen ligase family protein [Parvibaculum sp.]|uniref:O-antigen ligase family protein n=1 Tax=Parvibaculum sp. TaxID=2024848 RepID=UPI00284D89F7|nr:O-antigen ligase family protein [Parvibaculum sp.]MDR3499403.1 O-antigen ligase family protein [Parvibaculum sp.]
MPIPVLLFILSLVWPASIAITAGGIFLPVYRIVLLALIPVAIFELTKRPIRFRLPDFLIFAFSLIQGAVMVFHHGLTENIIVITRDNVSTTIALLNAGSTLVETAGPYLIARVYIRDQTQFVAVCRLLVLFVICVGAGTLIEATTGFSVFTQRNNVDVEGMRLGIHRAAGPFPHAILWGLFAADAFCFASMGAVGGGNLPMRATIVLLVLLAVFTSASSAAFGVVFIQIMLLAWIISTQQLRNRWTYFMVGCLMAYIFVDLLSNRSAIQVLFDYTALNSWTGYYRTLIWQYGWQDFLASPLVGIGFNDWARPIWMPPSIDAFWLVILLRYGLAGAGPLVGGIIMAIREVERSTAQTTGLLNVDPGFWWIVSLTSLITAGFTVHFWAHGLVYFFFLIGLWGSLVRRDARARPRMSGARALSNR